METQAVWPCVCKELSDRIKKLLLEEITGGATHIKQFHSPHVFWVSELINTNLVILSYSNQTRLVIGVKIYKRQMRKNVRNVAWLFWKATHAMARTSVLLGIYLQRRSYWSVWLELTWSLKLLQFPNGIKGLHTHKSSVCFLSVGVSARSLREHRCHDA